MALNTGTYNITPGESQKELDARRQMAYALWKEGMDAQPIRHWAQGLAGLAKAGIGGYELYQADESDRKRSKAISDALKSLPGMEDASGEASGAPTGTATSPGNSAMAAALRTGPSSGANYMTGALPGADAITKVSTPGGISVDVHKDAAPAFTGFLGDLEAAGAPIRGVGGYDQRKIAGTDKWSQHAYGNAIDIDQTGRNATAQALRDWGTTNKDKLAEIEKKYGMVGGQNFSNPDWGHWEWSGKSGGLTPPAPREANIGPPMPDVSAPQITPSARPPTPPGVPISPTDVSSPAAVPAQVAPAAPASAPAPPVPPVVPPSAAGAERRSPRMTPAQQAQIAVLWNNDATRPLAHALYQEYAKPKDQWIDLPPGPDGALLQRNVLTHETKVVAPNYFGSWKIVDADEGPLGKTKMLQGPGGQLVPISAGMQPGGPAAPPHMTPGGGAQPAGGFQNVGFQNTQAGAPQGGGPAELGYLKGFNWNESDPEKFLNQLDDANMKGGTATRSAVRAYLNGDVVPTGNPRQYGIADAAKKIAQRFGEITGTPVSDALYAEKRKFRTELGSNSPSSVGGQSKAFVQGIEHAVDLGQTLKKLDNSNGFGIPVLAEVTNTIRQGVSNDQHALADKAQGIGQTLAGEVGKLFSGSAGGGVHEREMTRARFSTVRSRPQLAAALEATLETMEGGLTALEARRDAVFGPNSRDTNIELVPQQTREKVNELRGIIADLKGGAAKSTTPAAAAAPAAPVPSQAAEFLKKNPATKDQFIAKYGADAFDQIMGGK